jgi:transcriptional regulator with XRE-family HTH domain
LLFAGRCCPFSERDIALDAEQAFGQVLRELRRKKGLTQEVLAFEAGLDRNYVSLLELGRNSASVKTVFKLAAALSVSVAEFMSAVEIRVDGD